MDVRVTDLGDLEEALEGALDRIGELRAGTRVASDAFFSKPFMRAHTQYDSFSAFRSDAPVELDVPLDDQPSIDIERLNEYIQDVSEFESWTEMQTQAAHEEIVTQLTSNTA